MFVEKVLNAIGGMVGRVVEPVTDVDVDVRFASTQDAEDNDG